MQPVITKNTAVFHSNSVKYYHFKQSSCSTLPTATTPHRARGGEGGWWLKDSSLQRAAGPKGPWALRMAAAPRTHGSPSSRHKGPLLGCKRLPHGLQLTSPLAEGKAHCSLCVQALLPNLHSHSLSYSTKSFPFQLLCANPWFTQPPLTLCHQVITVG